MIVHVASLKPAKVDAVRQALAVIASVDDRFRAAEVRECSVTTAAPVMPMTEREILDGARARVEALMGLSGLSDPPVHVAPGDADPVFFVGLEGGLDPLPDVAGDPSYTLKSWACVTDGHRWSYGAGGALVLPAALVREVLAGEELGDVIDRTAGEPVRGTRGAWGLLTRDLVRREDAFRVAVVNAFAPFYNAAYYR